jgi:hypothetical protein
MVQTGARPIAALQYLLELQRHWRGLKRPGKTTSAVMTYGGSYGLGVVYAAKMLNAAEHT